mmetsp:Transcript_30712/g.58251  ORF Transcript_30712/g.58251 Transcript_30712/m.58251 type:complete len:202 (-) Transcript_30712:294-899(-)
MGKMLPIGICLYGAIFVPTQARTPHTPHHRISCICIYIYLLRRETIFQIQIHKRCRHHLTIETIHRPSVPGYKVPEVLRPVRPLGSAREEPSERRNETHVQRQNHRVTPQILRRRRRSVSSSHHLFQEGSGDRHRRYSRTDESLHGLLGRETRDELALPDEDAEYVRHGIVDDDQEGGEEDPNETVVRYGSDPEGGLTDEE